MNVVAENLERSFGWVSFQPDGAISVGLRDKTFLSPTFRARNHIWNYYNRVTLEYLVIDSPKSLEPVINPHLTFHPPGYFHLHANRQNKLWAGWADLQLMLKHNECIPWIKFVSSPLRDLGKANTPRASKKSIIERIPVPSVDCSIGLGIDFIREVQCEKLGLLYSRIINWEDFFVHIFCEVLPMQIPTLSWFHQC